MGEKSPKRHIPDIHAVRKKPTREGIFELVHGTKPLAPPPEPRVIVGKEREVVPKRAKPGNIK